MGVTIVSVKAQTAGDTGTGHVANHPAREEASRAGYEGARGRAERAVEEPFPSAVGANRAATMNAIAITRLMIPSVMWVDALHPQSDPPSHRP